MLFACGDSDPDTSDCETDPAITVLENLQGTWMEDVDGDSETVTFNADGTGSSTENSSFTESYEGFDYDTFTWGESSNADFDFEVTWDFDQTNGPIFSLTLRYNAPENLCDRMEIIDGFGNEFTLTK